jgi:hypothetical protein
MNELGHRRNLAGGEMYLQYFFCLRLVLFGYQVEEGQKIWARVEKEISPLCLTWLRLKLEFVLAPPQCYQLSYAYELGSFSVWKNLPWDIQRDFNMFKLVWGFHLPQVFEKRWRGSQTDFLSNVRRLKLGLKSTRLRPSFVTEIRPNYLVSVSKTKTPVEGEH